MTIDLTKPVQTADGRKARVLCTDRAEGQWPVVALITGIDGRESIYGYNLLGKHLYYRDLDLINIDTTPKNLRIAREAAAQVWADMGAVEIAKRYRAGGHDDRTEILAILKALEMVA